MKSLQLVITDPCTKQWNEIEQANGKHYCSSCEKNILDLSDKTDEELFRFFQRKKENVCARVVESQLNRKLSLPVHKINWHWLMPFALGAIVVNPALAQNSKPVLTQGNNSFKLLPSGNPDWQILDSVKNTFTGNVISQRDSTPLAGVKISKKGYENVLAVSDANGQFQLRLSDSDRLSQYVFKLNTFEAVETAISDRMIVRLTDLRRVMLGGISVVKVDKTPLYVVFSGNKSCTVAASEMHKISPEWIENMEVVKRNQATALYGKKGKNGVIQIWIKKAYRKKFAFTQKSSL